MAENIVQGIRDAIADLLVPELKAMKQQLEYQQDEQKGICEEIRDLRQDMNLRFQKVDERFEKMNERFQKVDDRFQKVDERFQKVDERFEQMHREMCERFQKVDERFQRVDDRFKQMHEDLCDIKTTQREILTKLDVDKRLRRMEVLFEEAEKQRYRHAIAS